VAKEKIRIGGKLYFFCEKCRRKFMFEKTYSEHKCEAMHMVWLPDLTHFEDAS
jgi:hypothetical protein